MKFRPLNQLELDLYDVLDPKLARKVRLLWVPYLPGGYDGMTIWRLIMFKSELPPSGYSTLLAHELVHVAQVADEGIFKFSWIYTWDFFVGLVKHKRWHPAYRDVRYEVEARWRATAWHERHTKH